MYAYMSHNVKCISYNGEVKNSLQATEEESTTVKTLSTGKSYVSPVKRKISMAEVNTEEEWYEIR
jgi:hypothetical protein